MPVVRYAFLVLREHPYGREMLRQLLAAGLPPAAIVEEASPVAEEERLKFEERLAGQPLPPSFDELLASQAVPRLSVPHHNRAECEAALREVRPELLVLGGTRILRRNIFELAPGGALNAHPGLLPEVRGSASVAWAIYHDLPVGCTCHFIDAGVDTGDIVGRQTIPVRRGATYEQLAAETLRLSGELMTQAVRAYSDGTLIRTPQPAEGQTFRVMPPELVAEVRAKLASGAYRHFVD